MAQQRQLGLFATTLGLLGLTFNIAISTLPANAATTMGVALASVAEASRAAHFAEPLIATSPTDRVEDEALVQALARYSQRSEPSNVTALDAFLTAHPHSGWSAAISTNLGFSYLHDGYFSRAIDAWKNAWLEGRNSQDPQARALVDRAVGELARLDANLGHMDELANLFDDIGKRPITGSATEAVQEAREQLVLVEADPRHLFICGPLALQALMLAEGTDPEKLNFLQFYRAGPNGTNLADLDQLADQVKLDHRLILRKPGEPVPVPSIVHWKVGHFAAIVGKSNGRYRVQDSVFAGSEIWVTQDALDAEASGYFLVPSKTDASQSWASVDVAQAKSIWGKGPTGSSRPGDAGDINANDPDPVDGPPKPSDPLPIATPNRNPNSAPGIPPNNCPVPLCVYNIKESSVAVSLSDTPVGYTPAIGPAVKVRISYNQREDSQPANFAFFNVGPKWTLNWLSYVIDDPTNPGANVSRFMAGGGAFYYLGYNAARKTFAPQDDDGSILAIIAQSPASYRRQLRDGTVELYAQSDGSVSYPRKIFLSQVIDPQGNKATLHYDSQQRLTSITDAVGRDTTFSYAQAGRPLLVTKITDPFGRSARLTYDDSGRLASITDIIGLTSRFTYDANSLVNSQTTPYGTTSFSYTAPGTSSPPRFVQVTDPLGYKEREEWLEPAPIPASDPSSTLPVGMPVPLDNVYLTYRNSFHWDKDAYVAAGCTDTGGCDYAKARLRHFVHMPGTSVKGTAIESEKRALENRVWFNYPGQITSVGALYGGTYNKPIAIGRVLDDGTSQISRFSYDTSGFNLTKAVDPLGRTTYYAYANGSDLAAVSQTAEFGTISTLAQYAYNAQHRPVSYTDAAGRNSTYEYNAAGQITSATDSLGERTTFQYDSNSNLHTITNANAANAGSYTYDSFNRVWTYTDSEGWSVTYDYDAADRLTRVSYPDGTARRYTYDKLDLASYTDREGRRWQYQHDANRRLTTIVDPLGHTALLNYDSRGLITTLTDPKGNVTAWSYDLQGRLIGKTYADRNTASYTYENTTSRLKSVLDALGQTKQYQYAVDDNVVGLGYLNAVNPTPNVLFTYDPNFPRIESMVDATGTTSYSYYSSFVDGAQQLQQECFKALAAANCSHQIDYVYDPLGRLASRTVAGSGAEIFQYDAIGRLKEHSSDLGAFSLGYLGQTAQLANRNLLPAGSGLSTSWSYLDNAHDRRLAAINDTGLSTGQFTNFTFTTTPENFITGIIHTSDATVPSPNESTQTASFNNLNQLIELSGQTYSYDKNGNLLADGQRTYGWDAENRLVKVMYPALPGKQIEFTYDGLGRRVAISSAPAGGGSSTTTSYLWCGDRICGARSSAGIPQRSYFDEGEFVTGSPSRSLYYGVDQIGSVRRVFESATNAPAYDYGAWGTPLKEIPQLADFGFAGLFKPVDGDFGLTWFRIYDSQTATWLSRDPLEELGPIQNLYQYASNNPLSNTDSIGLFPRPQRPSSLPCPQGDQSPPNPDLDPIGWRKCLIQICIAAGLLNSGAHPTEPPPISLEDAAPDPDIQDPTKLRTTTRRRNSGE